jgi:hypothetical protein
MWNDALPRNGITNWQTFYAVKGAATTDSWQTWMKPAGCAWIYILMLGSGGGGGKSNNGALTVAAGGGASGGHARLLFPAFVVPDILYVRTGTGGLGATTAGSGAAGVSSYVSMYPSTVNSFRLGAIAGGSGGGGAATNTGGSAGTALGFDAAIGCFGLISTVIGSTGGAGASASNGSGVTIFQPGNAITMAGTGGGNGTGAGGSITNIFPTIAGGIGTTGGAGNAGFQLGAMWTPGLKSFPMLWSGGSGGGGHSTGTAGNGGKGSYGGGGGGSGACSGAGTSGNGGDGGDGIIFIGAF